MADIYMTINRHCLLETLQRATNAIKTELGLNYLNKKYQ